MTAGESSRSLASTGRPCSTDHSLWRAARRNGCLSCRAMTRRQVP